MKGLFFSGTSGIVMNVARENYPPPFQGRSRLEYYSHLFNSVEINSTFYKLPKAETIIKWTESVPDHFRFTFKMPKLVSHVKHLMFQENEVRDFLRLIDVVENKKACILLQFPASLKKDSFNALKELLSCISVNNSGWKVSVELRNVSWYDDELYTLLHAHQACLVLHDLHSAPAVAVTDNAFSYLRFHGPGGRYRGSYEDAFIQGYADIIRTRLHAGKEVYCYFNNTMGDAIGNLQTLINMVAVPN